MTLQLTPWDNATSFVDPQTGILTQRGQFWLNEALQQIYDEVGALAAAEAAQNAADAANLAAANADAAATAAQGVASDAQAAADATSAKQSLTSSGVIGLSLTGTDAGSSATITVSGHTRVYGDGTTATLAGSAINSLSYNTKYYVYYLDPTRSGGAVTYIASTTPSAAIQVGDVHSLGEITTPVALAGMTTGSSYPPPGILPA